MSTDTTTTKEADGCQICNRSTIRIFCSSCSSRINQLRRMLEIMARRGEVADYVGGLTERELECAAHTRMLKRVDGEVIVRCPDCDGGGPPAEVDAHDCPEADR